MHMESDPVKRRKTPSKLIMTIGELGKGDSYKFFFDAGKVTLFKIDMDQNMSIPNNTGTNTRLITFEMHVKIKQCVCCKKMFQEMFFVPDEDTCYCCFHMNGCEIFFSNANMTILTQTIDKESVYMFKFANGINLTVSSKFLLELKYEGFMYVRPVYLFPRLNQIAETHFLTKTNGIYRIEKTAELLQAGVNKFGLTV